MYMKHLSEILLSAAMLMAVSGCKIVDRIDIDLPLGEIELEVGLTALEPDSEETSEDGIAVAKSYVLDIDDDQLFNTLKYYKNDEVTITSISDISLTLIKFSTSGTGAELRNLLITASVDEQEICRYANPLIEEFDEAIPADEELQSFMENVIKQAVAGKQVDLDYTAVFASDYTVNPGTTPVNVSLSQEVTAKVTVRR